MTMTRPSTARLSTSHLSLLSFLSSALALGLLLALLLTALKTRETAEGQTVQAQAFATPQEAADALIDAAEKYDVAALQGILGLDVRDIIQIGEPVRDRQQAAEFSKQAREKNSVVL